MNVTFACPACRATVRLAVADDAHEMACPDCGHVLAVPVGAIDDGRLNRCLICPGHELFVRKDFSQKLGISIIVLGFVASSVTWAYYRPIATFGILLGTALLDLVLYMVVGNVLQCYRCQSIYRGVAELEAHQPFSLETHERYRQQAARQVPAGSAGPTTVAAKALPLRPADREADPPPHR